MLTHAGFKGVRCIRLNAITYSDGKTIVKVGDTVQISYKKLYFFKATKLGQITYVYDPAKPSTPHINDVGVGIKISENQELFGGVFNGVLDPNVTKIANT